MDSKLALLDKEEAIALPDREALWGLNINFAHVTAINAAVSSQNFTFLSLSNAVAAQTVTVSQ